MPRNMSFMLTTEQVENGSKVVTRRTGWSFLLPGDLITACEKCQGIPKGGKIRRIAQIRIVSVRREFLGSITYGDCVLEGFPDMSPRDFIDFFIHHCPEKNITELSVVNRIEFEYIGFYHSDGTFQNKPEK